MREREGEREENLESLLSRLKAGDGGGGGRENAQIVGRSAKEGEGIFPENEQFSVKMVRENEESRRL